MIFIANYESAKVEQSGKEPLDFIPPHITAQRASILRGRAPVDFVWGDQGIRTSIGGPLVSELAALCKRRLKSAAGSCV